ncbi:MAG TPA: class I adenylate-forming enzyme family protein [Burkholderiales bacterium]|nr:class I adenylate-forming enzyme family protein [Burkholderiales bacterium]
MERPRFNPEREREFITRGWWRDDTLPKWLARHAVERADSPAMVFSGGAVTWKALQERVLKVAQCLKTRGVSHGDVVAVQLPNIPEFIIAYLAITRLRAVMCTLHMPYRGAEIEAILGHSQARLFLNSAASVSELEDADPLTADHPEPDPEDPFLLLYTSGTTASPKGVPHPYRTMLSNARLGAKEHRLTEDDRILSPAPFSHLYGLYSLHCAWAVGACTVLLPAFKPEDLAGVIQNQKPTALWTAPAHIAACRAAGLFERHDWSSLRLAIVSGSSAPPALIREFAAALPQCAVTQLWGMTELQAGLYTRPGDPLEWSASSAGRPSPGAEVRISPEGEILVRGPLLFSGYFNNPEEDKTAFTPDGWFRSGDLGELREGGNIAITGRIKDIINRGGVKFNPLDVEKLLDSHPKIMQSAIVPMPDPVLGEKACVFVTLKTPSEKITLDELVDYLLKKNIAKNKLPERLVVVPEMPLTPTRKIIKGRLRVLD